MLTDIIGYISGFLLALCFLPQIVRTIRRRSADDVSMYMLLLTFSSAVGYEIYAWRLELMPVVIMNGIFALMVLFEIILKAKFDGLAGNKKPAT